MLPDFFFFFKVLADTCPFLGPLVPLFWISGDVSSGFQSQSGFCLIRYFRRGECNVHSPRFTCGATLADLLVAGMQPVTSPHACAEVGLGSDSNVQPHEQKTNALPLCQRPGFVARLLMIGQHHHPKLHCQSHKTPLNPECTNISISHWPHFTLCPSVSNSFNDLSSLKNCDRKISHLIQ